MSGDPVREAFDAFMAGDGLTAEALLLAAAHAGNGHAAHNLAVLYLTGCEGVAVDREKARAWIERARGSGFEASVSSDPDWLASR
jgi:TPR repeat protein